MTKELYKIITQLKEEVTESFLKQIESIASSILAMTGRVAMLGILRWNDTISYKTIERFFDKKLNWLSINYQIIKPKLGENIILVADESTISKFLTYSLNDIKSLFRTEKYTRKVLKLYGEKVDDILINEAIWRVSAFSMIYGDVA